MFANSIQHLRLRGQPPAGARQLYDWLVRSDIEPPALPSAAILLVRQLQARGNWAGRQPHMDWSMATRNVLDRLLQAAARPASGSVPANVPAVLFADQAELLACLCRDWLAGQIGLWWWRSLFPAGIDGARLLGLLAQHSPLLPAVLRRLHYSRLATALLLALPPQAPAQLWSALLHDFALPDWPAALPVAAAVALIDEVAPVSLPPAPWQPFLPVADGLSPAAEMLLGVALQLAIDASGVHKPGFAMALAAWWQAQAVTPPAIVAAAATVVASPLPASGATVVLPDRVAGAAADLPEMTEPAHGVAADPAILAQSLTLAAAGSAAPLLAQLAVTPDTYSSAEPDAVAAEPAGAGALAAILAPAPASRVGSDFGGLFYLVNLALSLQLYGDFSQPRRPGIALPLWDWLALVGERLLGRALRDDDVWPLLAQLAGRSPGSEPGSGFAAPIDWQLPPDWRDWLDSEPPAAFGSLAQWLDWLTPLLLARLAFALDCPQQEVGALLCRQRAQLEVSEGRLDIHLRLDELQIEIRIAGLDRDPGWIPAAGCGLRFHFQA